MNQKECTGCHKIKSLDQFSRRAASRDGKQSRCKACEKAEQAIYRAAHRERACELSRRWRAAHPEKARADKHRWYMAHRERVLERARVRRYARLERERAGATAVRSARSNAT